MLRKKKAEVPEFEMPDALTIARSVAIARIALGIAAYLAPKKVMQAWVGGNADDPTTTVAARGLAARDIALGIGILGALEKGAPARGWVEAAAMSDAGDALATLLAIRDGSTPRTLLGLITSGGSALILAQAAQELD